MAKNELISINYNNGKAEIITTRGILKLENGDVESIKKGNFPSGIKKSNIIDGISLKSIRNILLKALVPKRREDGKNQATLLWELIQNSYFFCDKTGFAYILVNNIPMPVENVLFADSLAYLFYRNKGIIPSSESISLVQKLCRAKAKEKILEIGVRVHKIGSQLIYDPINDDGSVIFVNKDGITTAIPQDPLTVRHNGMLPAPIEDGEIEDLKTLLSLWNLGKEQEVVLTGIIGTNFVPDIPHVITVITGTHGAGKSSLSDVLKLIVDPNVVVRNSLRFDEREIAVSSMHEWVLNFDNVNSIIPDLITDLLCRISTGQGFRKRKLFTDQDDLILQYRRPIVITAINEPAYAPDFLDRALIIRLYLIPESQRKTDVEIQRAIERYVPRIRGLYLKALSRAIAIYPEVEKEFQGKLLRMADVIIWGEAIIRSLGYEPGKFYSSFSSLQLNETQASASENLLIMGIQRILKLTEEWRGTIRDLYDEIKGVMAEMGISEKDPLYKQLPKNYRDLGRKITSLLPSLLNLGIEIKEIRGNERIKVIRRVDKKIENFDAPQHADNVGNVGEAEKSNENIPTNEPTIKDGNVDNSKSDSITESDKEKNVSENTDITKNNVDHNVVYQDPEKFNVSSITDITGETSNPNRIEKNNFPEEDDNGYGFDYYRILTSFQYGFEKNGKTIKVNCKEGEIKKISNKIAILHRSCIEKACHDGHYDPVSHECITDMGGSSHE